MKKDIELLNALFEFATEGIIVSDNHGKITLVNPKAETLFGYSEKELLGQAIEILVPKKDTAIHVKNREAFYKKPHPRAMGMGMDLYAKRKDGTLFPVEISLSSFSTQEGNFVMSFIIDITERKRQDDALKKAHNELKMYAQRLTESNSELEQFAYVASHDLQEPLRKIQSFGERLTSKEKDKLSEQGKDYIERMQNASSRMQNLINDLLSFSRITTKAQPFRQINLNKVLNEVLVDIETIIEKAKAKLDIGNLMDIEADPTQMRQLFQNLISNACKFRKKGESLQIKIYCNQLPDKNAIEISIEDNGIGFNEKYADRIFNVFQRLEGREYEGSGIGLAICKKIAIRHNGTITVKSKDGIGTIFTITLPLKQ